MIKTDEELREEHQQDVDKAQFERMERLERLLQSHVEAAADTDTVLWSIWVEFIQAVRA